MAREVEGSGKNIEEQGDDKARRGDRERSGKSREEQGIARPRRKG